MDDGDVSGADAGGIGDEHRRGVGLAAESGVFRRHRGRGIVGPYLIVWVTHMKTTIDVADDLLARARAVAARDGDTLRNLVEEGLRLALAAREQTPKARAFSMRTFGGKGARAGLTPEFDGASWERIRDAAYGVDR